MGFCGFSWMRYTHSSTVSPCCRHACCWACFFPLFHHLSPLPPFVFSFPSCSSILSRSLPPSLSSPYFCIFQSLPSPLVPAHQKRRLIRPKSVPNCISATGGRWRGRECLCSNPRRERMTKRQKGRENDWVLRFRVFMFVFAYVCTCFFEMNMCVYMCTYVYVYVCIYVKMYVRT